MTEIMLKRCQTLAQTNNQKHAQTPDTSDFDSQNLTYLELGHEVDLRLNKFNKHRPGQVILPVTLFSTNKNVGYSIIQFVSWSSWPDVRPSYC